MNSLKQLRKEQAVERQAARDKRSILQQLELIKSRRGNSKREVARLTALLHSQNNKNRKK
jgi:hypothetical protein